MAPMANSAATAIILDTAELLNERHVTPPVVVGPKKAKAARKATRHRLPPLAAAAEPMVSQSHLL